MNNPITLFVSKPIIMFHSLNDIHGRKLLTHSFHFEILEELTTFTIILKNEQIWQNH